MKKICVVTASRAEYGIMKPLIKRLFEHKDIDLRIAVTGTHLSEKFGFTYREIESDSYLVDVKIDILSDEDEINVSKIMARALIGFSKYFSDRCPDALIVLGDRYEIFAVSSAAYNARIPIVHLYGGDTTEGALDEAYRHAISKMSYLHFVSNDLSRRRVIQLGEQPDMVINVGSMGIENALHEKLYSVKELEEKLRFSLSCGYAVVTFHPVTLEKKTAESQCRELIKAINNRSDLNYIITKANADEDGQIINDIWDEYSQTHDNVFVSESLGMKSYLSAASHAKMVIGNSSSGLYEVPAFHIPTINIGDRQKGRLKGETVIDCETSCSDILSAMGKAENPDFLEKIQQLTSLYGDGNSSELILNMLEKMIVYKNIDLKKRFYDIDFR